MREFQEGITFRQFAEISRLMGWTVEELATEFKGIAEKEPAASLFARVLRGDPDWCVVIPFRPVILKYLRAVQHLIADGKIRTCACGCRSPVLDAIGWLGPTANSNPRAVTTAAKRGIP